MNFITGESTNIEKVGISSLVPNTDNTLDVGTSSKRWRDGRFVNLVVGATSIDVGTNITSLSGRVDTLETQGSVLKTGDVMTGNLTCPSFIKTGGNINQYLMADGGVLESSANAGNSNFYLYNNTNSMSDITPINGEVIIDSTTNTSATFVYISHVTRDNIDVEVYWQFINQLTDLYIQDQSLSANYVRYNITGTPTITVGNKIAIPVIHSASQGTGSTSFGAGHNILVAFFTNNSETEQRISNLETKTQLQTATSLNTTFTRSITSTNFVTSGGLSTDFVKGNGTLDATTYLPTTGGTITGALTSAGGLNVTGVSVIDLQMVNINSIFFGLEYNNGSAVIATRSNSAWAAIGSTSAVDFNRAFNYRPCMSATALWSTTSLADGAVCGYNSTGQTTGAWGRMTFPFGFMCNLSIQDTAYNANNCQNFFGVSSNIQNLNQTTQLSDRRSMIGFGSNTTDANLCIYSASSLATVKLVDLGVNFPTNILPSGSFNQNWYRLAFWWDGISLLHYKCNVTNATAGTGITVSGSVPIPIRPESSSLYSTITRTMGTPQSNGQAKLAVQKAGVWY